MKFQIEKSKLLNSIDNGTLSIKFSIKCRRILGRDKKVGEVNIPLKDLYYLYSSFASNLDSSGSYKAAFSICSSHLENSRGVLYVSFMFGFGDNYRISEPSSAAAVPSAPYVDEWNHPVIDHPYDDYDSRSINCCYGSSKPAPSAPYLTEEEYI
ncbi:hypothetical protein RD792_001820 [Penstemon davidsonii]|uniref:Uncharacterized protein n=1 Tax=Penstemon davidsonii TaxID=160366 RepID=A0ABR0DQK7_9LAMI|nr:hypothetical protein RD792_001820 [Penstemon davidsonii]